ncbi:hypothetical protein FEM48_ZijujUnG0096500 [Ziziphus jujuba var. spinosa]|uniref:non-specific serine/threonine protein kinase n=1 Tax=Ziziphus jujuba var. spinosa TaxID=714518 RepID=A0A978U8F2_ZIZJJ|nr:hypothetical protein FEM48_ZijujUnG0096500 [Ziziphus jujuba var. spinosa]
MSDSDDENLIPPSQQQDSSDSETTPPSSEDSSGSPPPPEDTADQSSLSSSSPPPDSSSSSPAPPDNESSSSSSPPPPVDENASSSPPPPSKSGSPSKLASPPPSAGSPPPPPPPETTTSSPPPPPILSPPPTSPPPKSSSSSSASPPPPSPTPSTTPPPSSTSPPPPILTTTSVNPENPPPPFQPPPPPLDPTAPPTTPVSPPAVPAATPPATVTPSPPIELSPPSSGAAAAATRSPPPSNHTPTSSSNPTNSLSKTDSSSKSSSGSGGSSSNTGAIVGGTVAGIVVIALIAAIFLTTRRKKRKGNKEVYTTGHYAPPGNFSMESDQTHFASQVLPPPAHSSIGIGYGSQRGNGYYHGGGGHESDVISDDRLPVLEWTKRLKIALGSAKGLAYLHEDCHPKIIHRDIKTSNILLDDAFEAQACIYIPASLFSFFLQMLLKNVVSDFGLAKLSNDTNTHVSTRVMGTFGYMAPEYATSGKLTDRSDVFSFGVVLLELITGRKPVDPTQPLGDESLVEWARPHLLHALETGDLSELVDPRLGKQYVQSEMFRMVEAAAACVRHSAPKRPRMVQVVRALDCEGEASDLSNGVKYGQSTVYDSGQYSEDIMRFRRMALGSIESLEYDMYSGEFNSTVISGPQNEWKIDSSGESETLSFTGGNGERRISNSQSNVGSRRL